MVIITISEKRVTKYCTYCAKEIDAKAEICPKCGVRQPKQEESK